MTVRSNCMDRISLMQKGVCSVTESVVSFVVCRERTFCSDSAQVKVGDELGALVFSSS